MLDPLDRISVRRHQLFYAQAKKIRASISPATMYTVLQLRQLAEQASLGKSAYSEWYNCLSLLWDGDTTQAHAYPQLCDLLVQTLCGMDQENGRIAKRLLGLIDEQITPILRSMDYLYYKKNDIDLIKQIPFILTYRSDLHLVIPLQTGSGTAHFDNVASALTCGASQITYLAMDAMRSLRIGFRL